ncbi:MAG: HD domain-containing protein [Sedimentisphaerales bacterium]|nr:HD domain-containing protein [Sedimentisphaerales bacterium]
MLRVPIEQAKEGMILAHGVPNPKKPQHALLKNNFKLNEETIERLRKLRVYSLWVKYPNLDFLDDILDPELTTSQQKLYGTLKSHFTQAQSFSLAKVNYSQYTQQVSQLFSRLLTKYGKTAIYINELFGEADDLFQHGTTVSYISLLIGMRLENYLVHERPRLPIHLATDLTQMGVGCILHDIGKLSLPEEMRGFRLTAQDRGEPEWQKHTEIGYEMIHGGLDPSAAQVVLNHHQHFDGCGFPARKEVPGVSDVRVPLSGKDIHIFCRIATIADRFDGFRYLPDGTRVPTIVALKRMDNPGYAKWFDPLVVKAFRQTVPPFTPGDQVILNNGQTVVVTELVDNHPCRPIVRPIDLDKAQQIKEHDAKNESPESAAPPAENGNGEEKDIKLHLQKNLFIAKIGDYNVTNYLF